MTKKTGSKAGKRKEKSAAQGVTRKHFLKVAGIAGAGLGAAAVGLGGTAQAQLPIGQFPSPPTPPPEEEPDQEVVMWPLGDTNNNHKMIHVHNLLEAVENPSLLDDPNFKLVVNCTADMAELQGAFLRIGRDAMFTIRCIDGQYRQFWYAENPFAPENGIPEHPEYNPALLPSMYDDTNPNHDENFEDKYRRVHLLRLKPHNKPTQENPNPVYTPFYLDLAEPLNPDEIAPAVYVDHIKGLFVVGEIMAQETQPGEFEELTYVDYHPDLDGDVMRTELKRGPNCHGHVFTANNMWGKRNPDWFPVIDVPNPDPNGPSPVQMHVPPMKVSFKGFVSTGTSAPPENTLSTIAMSMGYAFVEYLDLTIVDFYDKAITAASSYFTRVKQFNGSPEEPPGPGCKLIPKGPNATGIFWTGMWGLASWANGLPPGQRARAFYGGTLWVQENTIGKVDLPMFRSIDSFLDDFSNRLPQVPYPGFPLPNRHMIFNNLLLYAPIGIGYRVKYADSPSSQAIRTYVQDNEISGSFGDLKTAAMWIHGENVLLRSNVFNGNGTGVLLWPVPLEPDQPYSRNFVLGSDFTNFTPHGKLQIPGIPLPDGTASEEQEVPGSAFIWLFPGADYNIVNLNVFGPVGKMGPDSDYTAIWIMGNDNQIAYGFQGPEGWVETPNSYEQTGLEGFKVAAAGIIKPGCILLDKDASNNLIGEYEQHLPPGTDFCTQVLDLSYNEGTFANNHVFPDLQSCDTKEYAQLLKLLGVYSKVSGLVLPQAKRPVIFMGEDLYAVYNEVLDTELSE